MIRCYFSFVNGTALLVPRPVPLPRRAAPLALIRALPTVRNDNRDNDLDSSDWSIPANIPSETNAGNEIAVRREDLGGN